MLSRKGTFQFSIADNLCYAAAQFTVTGLWRHCTEQSVTSLLETNSGKEEAENLEASSYEFQRKLRQQMEQTSSAGPRVHPDRQRHS